MINCSLNRDDLTYDFEQQRVLSIGREDAEQTGDYDQPAEHVAQDKRQVQVRSNLRPVMNSLSEIPGFVNDVVTRTEVRHVKGDQRPFQDLNCLSHL